MKYTASNILFPLYGLAIVLLIWLPFQVTKTETEYLEVKRFERWCDEHQEQELVWEIEDHEYLIKPTTHGYPEIVGLWSRFH